MDKSKLRTIFEYEFRRGTNAAQTARNINNVFGEDATNERTVERWYARFRSGDFSLEDHPHGRPKLKVNNDELRKLVESDPSQTSAVLSQHFNVSPVTIDLHLRQIGKVKKLEKWVPHQLSALQKRHRVDVCLSLLNRSRNEPFLHRIVTCDEKWILYNNRKRKKVILSPGEVPKTIPKPELHQRKIMVTVWWTMEGIVHYDFLPPGRTIVADYYSLELEEMMKKLTVKQPKLVNRDKPLLLHDNAKAHSAKKTYAKLRELGLETLPHPPYSPDLAPTDYHFFLNFDNFLRGRKFNSEEAVKSAFENFAGSLSLDFFRKGLSCLPEKWQKCVDSNGEYFD
ncbi:hypothetical protein RvY_19088 [Ramazzottius varieornatus]|uniref:Mos1 transposase HTH domain-containing protein n=1 Tax=Ramazzottius varieornatus TaxID=947166 RepID=A0A1D1W891_RAMVA|nr:hypothetical protein RvY_19088 [Ramazzottius varieornatus]